MHAKTVGIDVSRDEHRVRIVCLRCAGGRDRAEGEAVREGDEWGGEECRCARCGRQIPGVRLVASRL